MMRAFLWVVAGSLLAAALISKACAPAEGGGGSLAEASLGALPAEAPGSYRFAVIGDTGCCAPAFRQVLRQIAGERPLFILHTGDVSYEGVMGYGLFRSRVERVGIPLFAVLSNHDLVPRPSWAAARSEIAPPNFSFDFGAIRYILVNSAFETVSDHDLAWLEERLRTPGGMKAVVATHVPPFDFRNEALPGEPFPRGHSMFNSDRARRFVDLIGRARPAAVFLGHIHGSRKWSYCGVDYWVTGGGGGELEPGERHHYLRVEVNGTRLDVSLIEMEPIPTVLRAAWTADWEWTRFSRKRALALGIFLGLALLLTRPKRL